MAQRALLQINQQNPMPSVSRGRGEGEGESQVSRTPGVTPGDKLHPPTTNREVVVRKEAISQEADQ
ncbi:hypothetical protein C2845_PM11G04450 [Panicum miliaceum]|uniref:Uncharacterized protein n=1 Tax=Panicum miliaceum TaxID=4540 RepID=A0A3L6RNT9_PANMI|nr:hypothetical protein C2845_PM11G04450 [Panicum miliaceum]